jgi:exonuclease III
VATVNINCIKADGNAVDLGQFLEVHKPDVVGISETWLAEGERRTFPNYLGFFSGRAPVGQRQIQHGGVALLVREDLDFTVNKVLPHGDLLFIRGVTSAGRRLAFGVFYGPQNLRNNPVPFERLERQIQRLQEGQYEIVIMGDFNSWLGDRDEDSDILGPYINPSGRPRNANGRRLMAILRRRLLLCLNGRTDEDASTFQSTGEKSVLDLIIASPALAHDCSASPMVGEMMHGGHWPVVAELNLAGRRRRGRAPRVQWNTHRLFPENCKSPFTALLRRRAEERGEDPPEELPDWRGALQTELLRLIPVTLRARALTARPLGSVTRAEFEQCWADWLQQVQEAADASIKRKRAFKRQNSWWGPDLEALRRDIVELESRGREHGRTDGLCNELREARREYRRAIRVKKRAARKSSHTEMEESRFRRPRQMWKGIKRICGTSGGDQPLRMADGSLSSTAEERAEVLREHYEVLGNAAPPPEDRDEAEDRRVLQELERFERTAVDRPFEFTNELIQRALDKCKLDKASGSDGIPVEFLKYGMMDENLKSMFELCRVHRMTPHAFKEYRIFSLWKKRGSPHDCANYRGIALLNTVGKVYARVLAEALLEQVNDQLRDEQAGFRPMRSTEDQIVILKDTVDAAVGNKARAGSALNVIFVDFKAAYDRVWRPALWLKLYRMGVNQAHIRMLKELYSVVEARAMSGSAVSPPFQIGIGVRQGCVISPILFDIYVNDLIEDLAAIPEDDSHVQRGRNNSKFNSLMFADDLAMLSTSGAGAQRQLDVLDAWSRRWHMTVHPTKTKVMRFNNDQTQLLYRNTAIEEVDAYQYLGMWFEKDGSWTKESKERLAKAKRKAEHIQRFMKSGFIHPWTKMFVWSMVVRPVLEYVSGVFHPPKAKWDRFESVLHRACVTSLGVNDKSPRVGARQELGVRSSRGRKENLLARTKVRFEKKVATGCGLLGDILDNDAKDTSSTGFRHQWNLLWAALEKKHGAQEAANLLQDLRDAPDKEAIKEKAAGLVDGLELDRIAAEKAQKSSIKDIRKSTRDPFVPEPYTKAGDISSGRTMARIRLGTLPLQAFESKKNKGATSPTCKLCDGADETIKHFLLECPALRGIREQIPVPERTMNFLTGNTRRQRRARMYVDRLWKERLRILFPPDNQQDAYPPPQQQPHARTQHNRNQRNPNAAVPRPTMRGGRTAPVAGQTAITNFFPRASGNTRTQGGVNGGNAARV